MINLNAYSSNIFKGIIFYPLSIYSPTSTSFQRKHMTFDQYIVYKNHYADEHYSFEIV